MSRGTLAFLVFLVLVLGSLWLLRERETRRGGPALDRYPLCPGLDAERVRSLRIDHLERGFQLKLERDAVGRWYMTDPLEYPAEGALVRTLLAAIAGAQGQPAPEVERAQVELDPPDVVLELVEVTPAGERTARLELGAEDVDPALGYVFVRGHPAAPGDPGQVFLTTRMLSTTLERVPDDYREHRVTPMSALDIVALRRHGEVFLAEEGRRVPLDLDALQQPDGWKRVGQATVSLDPDAMALLARGVSDLRVAHFVDDAPGDYARYGLDPPAFAFEVEATDGSSATLDFGHGAAPEDRPLDGYTWYCRRRGFAHVWEIAARDIGLLTRPTELFYDQMVVRMLRANVVRLELEGGGARRFLALEPAGWSVWEDAGDGSEPAHLPGDEGAIQAALGLLERTQLVEHLPREAFVPCDPPLSLAVHVRDGRRMGGALGVETRDPKSGAQGRQYLRFGDQVVALIDPAVADLCQKPLEEFRSKRMHALAESEVRTVELEHGARTFAFVNNGENLWTPRGETIPAPRDFQQSLDPLLNLAVRHWLERVPEGEPELSVRLSPVRGAPFTLRFLRTAAGAFACVRDGKLAAEVDPALPERLLGLF